MHFRTAPDAIQKLTLLDDATRFEPAGGDPLAEQIAGQVTATGAAGAGCTSRRPARLTASTAQPY